MISIDDFAKVELKVGTVEAAERVEGSEKLLKMKVNLGEELPRQILAGLGKVYEPEQMVGKQVVVVANLEPKQLMGLESNGMVLAAGSPEGPVIIRPESAVESGNKIK